MHKLRLLRLVVAAIFAKLFRKHEVPDEFTVRVWITPFDCDVSRMLTQNYIAFASLGRWQVVLQGITLRKVLRNKWIPLTYSEHVRYYRSIRIFSFVTIRTRIVHFTEKMFYFEHRFEVRGKTVAMSYSSGSMHGPKGYVLPPECLPEAYERGCPPLSDEIRAWIEMDKAIAKNFSP